MPDATRSKGTSISTKRDPRVRPSILSHGRIVFLVARSSDGTCLETWLGLMEPNTGKLSRWRTSSAQTSEDGATRTRGLTLRSSHGRSLYRTTSGSSRPSMTRETRIARLLWAGVPSLTLSRLQTAKATRTQRHARPSAPDLCPALPNVLSSGARIASHARAMA